MTIVHAFNLGCWVVCSPVGRSSLEYQDYTEKSYHGGACLNTSFMLKMTLTDDKWIVTIQETIW